MSLKQIDCIAKPCLRALIEGNYRNYTFRLRQSIQIYQEHTDYKVFVVIFTTITLRNYFYIDMDPLHAMSFWRLLARLDLDIHPQNRCDGFLVWFKPFRKKNLSNEYGFPSGTRLMGILRIHLKIYLPECRCILKYNNTYPCNCLSHS